MGVKRFGPGRLFLPKRFVQPGPGAVMIKKVQIRRSGGRKFRTFTRRAEALPWAKEAEREIQLERQINDSDITLAEVIDCKGLFEISP